MKLVDYLRALLSQFVSKNDLSSNADTKQKIAFLSQLNTANGTYIDHQITQSEERKTAPYSGFAMVFASCSEKSWLTISSGGLGHQHTISIGVLNQIGIPVTKGDSVKVDYASNVTSPTLRFFKNMGGGLIQSLSRFFTGACYA